MAIETLPPLSQWVPIPIQERQGCQRQRHCHQARMAENVREESEVMITIEIQHSSSNRPARSIRVCDSTSLVTISRRAADHRRRVRWNAARRCLVAMPHY